MLAVESRCGRHRLSSCAPAVHGGTYALAVSTLARRRVGGEKPSQETSSSTLTACVRTVNALVRRIAKDAATLRQTESVGKTGQHSRTIFALVTRAPLVRDLRG